MPVPKYPNAFPNTNPYQGNSIGIPASASLQTNAFRFDGCGVIYVGFLKLPLPANPSPAVFTRLLSNSLNHFLLNKNLILMQPLIFTVNKQAITLSDNKNIGYNFILNSVAFVGTIPESPTNMFGLVLHCPPNPICVCHIFSTSLTRPQEQYLRIQNPTVYSAPEIVRYINYLIVNSVRGQPLCDASNYQYNQKQQFNNLSGTGVAQPNVRRLRNHQAPPNFEAEIFIDDFQFPSGGMYTVSDRKRTEEVLPPRPRPNAFTGGKPPRCGCQLSRGPDGSYNQCQHMAPPLPSMNPSASFDVRQAAMALARSRSLSRYYRKGHRGGSSRSSGSDDGRFGRGGGSSNGSGSFRLRYGSQRHRHDRRRRKHVSCCVCLFFLFLFFFPLNFSLIFNLYKN